MTIKNTIKRLFKGSNIKTAEVFGKEMTEDFKNANMSVEQFEKKYTRKTEKLIKNIPHMNNEQREKEIEAVSKGIQYMNDCNLQNIFKIAKNFDSKYNIAYQCLKKYQNELKKQ